jgi:predicted transcriptional regulator
MTIQLNSTLPERQPKRSLMFSIRLTEAEQDEIDTLAKRLKLPSSFMAQHFILEAVKHHKSQITQEAAVEA